MTCRLRSIPVEIVFRVAYISEDAILGMNFFRQYKCQLLMDKGILRVGDHDLICVDKFGGVLSTKIQVPKITKTPANSVTCRLIQLPTDCTGIVEHHAENDLGIRLASTLVTTTKKNQVHVVVRCINPHPYPIQIRAGTTVGVFSVVGDRGIFTNREQPTMATLSSGAQVCDGSDTVPQVKRCGVSHHTSTICTSKHSPTVAQQFRRNLTELLNNYSDVFSENEADIGCTDMVLHEIPVEAGSKPIKLPLGDRELRKMRK